MHDDQESLLDAVNALVQAPDPTELLDALAAAGQAARKVPIALVGEYAVLNPLLNLQTHNPDGFQRIKDLIDTKRVAAGLPRCWPEPMFDKREYQRVLMQQRRQRSGRALEIENAQRPERDRLRGTARLEFENSILARWGADLSLRVDAARIEKGRRLTKDEDATIRAQFWEAVDAQLDERERALRQEHLKPAHLRQKI